MASQVNGCQWNMIMNGLSPYMSNLLRQRNNSTPASCNRPSTTGISVSSDDDTEATIISLCQDHFTACSNAKDFLETAEEKAGGNQREIRFCFNSKNIILIETKSSAGNSPIYMKLSDMIALAACYLNSSLDSPR